MDEISMDEISMERIHMEGRRMKGVSRKGAGEDREGTVLSMASGSRRLRRWRIFGLSWQGSLPAGAAVLFLMLLSLLLLPTQGCKPDRKTAVRGPAAEAPRLIFAFYNVENLYDTHDDPRSGGDDEFLPSGRKQWDPTRYQEKLQGLSEALRDLGGKELPAVIGFCEVENRKVVEELMAMPALAAGNYQVVHYDDRDSRGIDLALAYRPDQITVEEHQLIPVRKERGGSLARGLLSVTARSENGETFHIFVSHWPSRDDRDQNKEEGRKRTAAALREAAASLLTKDTHTHVVIMGDMNDEPSDESLLKVLKALPPEQSQATDLANLMFPSMEKGHGSYLYQGEWKMLDNLVVSGSLLDHDGYSVEQGRGFVFSNSGMEFRNRSGQISPDRSYVGDRYTGGISDHFPVYFTLTMKDK